MVALEANAEATRYLNGGYPVLDAGLLDADFLTTRGEEPQVLAPHQRVSGAFVGWFALFDEGLVDVLRSAEIGYRLIKSSWGSGYATEGVNALIKAAFESLGYARVRAETIAANKDLRRVLAKTGLRQDMVFPKRKLFISGAGLGEVIYEIRKPK